MLDDVLVALNSNLGPAAPASHFPIAEEDETGLDPDSGRSWALSVGIDLPAAAGSANCQADSVDQAKQAIPQFLKSVEENGLLCIFKRIVSQFNCETLLQQKLAIEYCFGELLCPGLTTSTQDSCGRVVASTFKVSHGQWCMAASTGPQTSNRIFWRQKNHGLLYQFLVQLG
jgi:hypothetical protein